MKRPDSSKVEMKIASCLFTNSASIILSFFSYSSLIPSQPHSSVFLPALYSVHICTLILNIPNFHLRSLLLLHPDSGTSDRLCLAYWSCLSSSPLPTVLKEHTRRWLILSFFSLCVITILNYSEGFSDPTEINMDWKRQVKTESTCPNKHPFVFAQCKVIFPK